MHYHAEKDIYIYIYIERERESESENKTKSEKAQRHFLQKQIEVFCIILRVQ